MATAVAIPTGCSLRLTRCPETLGLKAAVDAVLAVVPLLLRSYMPLLMCASPLCVAPSLVRMIPIARCSRLPARLG